MAELFTLTTNEGLTVIFPKHIAYLTMGEKGITIHMAVGGEHVKLETEYTQDEMTNMIMANRK